MNYQEIITIYVAEAQMSFLVTCSFRQGETAVLLDKMKLDTWDQFRFQGNWSPIPPQSQHFALSEK